MNLRRLISDIAFEDSLADQYEDGGEMVVTDECSASAIFGFAGRSSPVIGRWAPITPWSPAEC
jgi:hypothetical protein